MRPKNIIDLKTAVSHIRQACETEGLGASSPFFFIVGAGISRPVVPLASQIVLHCKETAQRYERVVQPEPTSPIELYSTWFQAAYPHPKNRQEYIRRMIEGKSITRANLRLAHLLSEKKVSNLVVTPNFDDFVSRALTLFGIPHVTCDHPHTVERIDPEQRDLQIVHVHGTYWFYDCCNSSYEVSH